MHQAQLRIQQSDSYESRRDWLLLGFILSSLCVVLTGASFWLINTCLAVCATGAVLNKLIYKPYMTVQEYYDLKRDLVRHNMHEVQRQLPFPNGVNQLIFDMANLTQELKEIDVIEQQVAERNKQNAPYW